MRERESRDRRGLFSYPFFLCYGFCGMFSFVTVDRLCPSFAEVLEGGGGGGGAFLSL